METMDFEEYNRALEKFVAEVQATKFYGEFSMQNSLSDLCRILGIGRISMKKKPDYENMKGFHGNLEKDFFVSPDADEGRIFTVSEHADRMVDIDYFFYQVSGRPDWDEECKKRITTVCKLIYSFDSCFLLVANAMYTQFHDMRFDGIHNVVWMHDFLNERIADGTIKDFNLVYFNLHNFSTVNRKIGDKATTRILGQYFTGLKNIIEKEDDPKAGAVSALGGDNGIACYKKELHSEISAYLSYEELEADVPNGTEKIILVSHQGYATELLEYKSSYELFESVSLALSASRRAPGCLPIYYNADFRKKLDWRRFIDSVFLDSLKSEEFKVYYQPKIELQNYRLKGAEALVRWFHDGKQIFPDQFIPVLERNLSIKHLDLYMLKHVCADIKKWLETGMSVPQISVNLSRASLQIHDIVSKICGIIDSFEIPRSLIQIELTESASDNSNEELRPLVEGLESEGISTAVDDFGTGFSSLSLIQELPWSMLKIDKSLLVGAQENGSRKQRMFKSIINMARDMGLECIVEGVETKEDVRLLKESGCYLAQGYYFSRPIAKENFESMLG